MSGASPSDGSSSRSRRGRAISARAIDSICCSPPESVPPRWCRRSLRRGKSVKTRSASSSKCFEIVERRAHLQIFEHRHAREDAAPLRRLRDPHARDLVRRHAGDVAPVIDDRAVARLRIAADRHHQRRLAGAVGADQRDDLAVEDIEVDAAQRDDLAVDRSGRRGHGEERRRRRCRSSRAPPAPRGLLRPSRPPRPRRRDRRR